MEKIIAKNTKGVYVVETLTKLQYCNCVFIVGYCC